MFRELAGQPKELIAPTPASPRGNTASESATFNLCEMMQIAEPPTPLEFSPRMPFSAIPVFQACFILW
jgi:hypothetical protein